jgi:DNA-binding NarL/FixJ family response regulator
VNDNSGSILIVDDDPALRELVSTLCRRAGHVCFEAASGEEALLAATMGQRPDVVLLDVKLGNGSGYQVCRDLRELFRDEVSIIFMSGERTDSSDKVAGLLLGADDYITKPFEPDELLARVSRAVARSSGEPSAGGGARLTPREREVLSLLANGEGTKAISARLHISPKTVSTHVQRMLIKLDLHSRAEAVAFAYREGLVEKSPARTVAVPGH